MMLLPVVFMVHEYEEIMMFRRWIDRNREELRKRFPKIELFFTRQGVFDYSTSTFAVGTAHEFILISVVSFCSVWTGECQWWFAALLHLCFCRIFKNHSSILFPNGFMGSYWHCSYRTKFVFCILLYGQISTMGKGKMNSKSTRNKRWKIIIRQTEKRGIQEQKFICILHFTT